MGQSSSISHIYLASLVIFVNILLQAFSSRVGLCLARIFSIKKDDNLCNIK